jgi:hypothetical protein
MAGGVRGWPFPPWRGRSVSHRGEELPLDGRPRTGLGTWSPDQADILGGTSPAIGMRTGSGPQDGKQAAGREGVRAVAPGKPSPRWPGAGLLAGTVRLLLARCLCRVHTLGRSEGGVEVRRGVSGGTSPVTRGHRLGMSIERAMANAALPSFTWGNIPGRVTLPGGIALRTQVLGWK